MLVVVVVVVVLLLLLLVVVVKVVVLLPLQLLLLLLLLGLLLLGLLLLQLGPWCTPHPYHTCALLQEPIPVLPTVHYNMGGIPTNYYGEVVAPKVCVRALSTTHLHCPDHQAG